MEVTKKDKSPIEIAIQEMGVLRNNIPQFLFADGIGYTSSVKLSQAGHPFEGKIRSPLLDFLFF